jgi:hypothetical protein
VRPGRQVSAARVGRLGRRRPPRGNDALARCTARPAERSHVELRGPVPRAPSRGLPCGVASGLGTLRRDGRWSFVRARDRGRCALPGATAMSFRALRVGSRSRPSLVACAPRLASAPRSNPGTRLKRVARCHGACALLACGRESAPAAPGRPRGPLPENPPRTGRACARERERTDRASRTRRVASSSTWNDVARCARSSHARQQALPRGNDVARCARSSPCRQQALPRGNDIAGAPRPSEPTPRSSRRNASAVVVHGDHVDVVSPTRVATCDISGNRTRSREFDTESSLG